MSVWVASSYENVFQDSVKPGAAGTTIDLVVVRNEYESAQIAMRQDSAFSITGVTFSNLTSGSNTIAKSNLKYNFVEYDYIGENTSGQAQGTTVKWGPGYYPDALSNNATKSVSANKTQPIWVTAYIPKTAAAGTYTGTATVNTNVGNFPVDIKVEVNNATIPDSKDGNFSWFAWQQTGGTWGFDSWKDSHPNDNIQDVYGYERYTPQWWALVGDIAQKMKEGRINVLYVNTPELLVDGGTTLTNGTYNFNWSKVDEYIQYHIDRGVVKYLEGGPLFDVVIKNDASGKAMKTVLPISDPIIPNFLDQFLPALHTHLQQKGWLDIWFQHVGDEPHNQAMFNHYAAVVNKARALAPGLKLGDAIYTEDALNALVGSNVDWYIPRTDLYDTDRINQFDSFAAAGKVITLYDCNWPQGNYMNRFLDKPVYENRLHGWLAYSTDTNSFLHWGWNYWTRGPNTSFLPADDQLWKGDPYIVHPDIPNNKIKDTIRSVGYRDAAEDFEVFKILESTNKILAKNISRSIVPDSLNFSRNIDLMIAAKNQLVRAAGAASSNVSYWNLDAGSGSVAADSWDGNSGSIIGTPTWVDGKDGKALKLNGSSSGILLGKKNLAGPWTASLWVKREAASGISAALFAGSTVAIKLEQYNNTKKVGITKMGVGDFTFNYTAPIDTWVNLAFVGSSKGTALYVNGIFQDSIPQVIDLPLDSIGYGRSGGSNIDFMKGTIDDIKIYRTALTAAQIASITASSGLIADWKFEEQGAATGDSAGTNTGYISGGVTRAAGARGNGLVFNGSTGKVDLNMKDIPVPWTASMWVKKGASKDSASLLSSNNGALKLDQWENTNKVGISRWGTFNVTFNYSAPIGQWVNLTFVGTSSGTSLYADGVLKGTVPESMPLPLDTMGYRRFPHPTNPYDFLNGAIDDVKVFNRALSKTEITALMNNTATIVSLKSLTNNNLVTAPNAGNSPLIASQSAATNLEKFEWVNNTDGTISLKSLANNKYVCADGDYSVAGTLIARSSINDAWERFNVVTNGDGTISLRAVYNDKYVAAENAGAGNLVARSASIDTWEKFQKITY